MKSDILHSSITKTGNGSKSKYVNGVYLQIVISALPGIPARSVL